MSSALEISDAGSTQNDRIKRRRTRATESNAGPFIFPALCQRLGFTAKKLADIGDAHPRTAEFWLSGSVEAPPIVFAVVQAEIIRRDRETRAAARR
jgi:hypothetical protein